MSLVIHVAVSELRPQRAFCISPSLLLLTFIALNLRLERFELTSEDFYIFLLKIFSGPHATRLIGTFIFLTDVLWVCCNVWLWQSVFMWGKKQQQLYK